MAGNQEDLIAGLRDHGSAIDMQRALVDAAAIISTGTRPSGVDCALTVDGLLTAARDHANGLRSAHRVKLDALTAALVACPDDVLVEPQLRDILGTPPDIEQVTA